MDRRAALLALTIFGLALTAVPRSGGVGPTYVEGFVSGDWTPEASPYILLGNATVPAEATLVVHAGVEVRANRGMGLQVFGSLIAEGTPAASVRFTANGTADHGFWSGIHAAPGSFVSLSGTTVEAAGAGLFAMGATVSVTGSSFAMNFRGLDARGSVVTAKDTSIAQSAQAGVVAREGTSITISHGFLSGNRVHADLATAEALIENTTFLGDAGTIADLTLDFGAVARLRTNQREGFIKINDDASRVELEGILAVAVTDNHGTPVAGANVRIEDNANSSWSTSTATNAEGLVPGIVVTERTMYRLSSVDYNPFRATAEAKGSTANADVVVNGFMDLLLALPNDLTPPTPIAARTLAVDEDTPIAFDASASRDNDPDLATTGTFVWQIPDLGVVLIGVTATHVFDTPGTLQGILTVSDAGGNSAFLSFTVQVRDVTPPTIGGIDGPIRSRVGETATYVATASDNDPVFASTATFVWRFSLGSETFEESGPQVEFTFHEAGAWRVELTVTDAAANEDYAAFSVEVVVPPTESNLWPWIVGGAALLAAAIGLATERGKVGFLTLLLPLYTRIKDEEVLDQFTRGQIYGYVRVHPGDTYTDIKRNLDLNNGTLTYHLDVLEKQRLVRSIVRGSRKMFYPVDVRPPDDGGGLHELQRRLLKGLGEAPGISVTTLAASLGISRQLALYHLRLLQRSGLVRLERRGVKLCGFVIQPRL